MAWRWASSACSGCDTTPCGLRRDRRRSSFASFPRQLGIRRQVELLSSPRRAMPMTWGLWRTCLLLPEEAIAWDAAALCAVLLHELAHAKRRDCLTQLAAQVACALYWFNPLVWLAWRQMLTEREGACDDLVLRHGQRHRPTRSNCCILPPSCALFASAVR